MLTLLVHMVLAAVLAGVIAVTLTPLVKRLAVRAGVVRAPRGRDVHKEPIPLWGGLAMFVGFTITVLLLVGPRSTHEPLELHPGRHPILGILLGSSLIALLGLLDDKYDLPAWAQTLGILAAGFLAATLGARIDGITNPFVPLGPDGQYTSRNYLALGNLATPITMLWIYLVTKTVDFLDGLDGLAAGVCAISAMSMGLLAVASHDVSIALMAGALVGACVGFLRHNYNPASIFMGTVGAQFLGFVLATMAAVGALKIPATISVVIPLLVLGVPVFDGIFVVVKRIWKRTDPTKPDRTSHIHHRLLNRGLTTKQTVWAVYGLTASCCLLALLLAWTFVR